MHYVGPIATKTPLVRSMRVVKKETLKLIDIFVQKTEDPVMVMNNIVPPLLEIILSDYTANNPLARDAEVLSTTATLIMKLGDMMTDKVNAILSSVFQCTVEMINKGNCSRLHFQTHSHLLR
jgi:exportin-1